MDSSRSGPLSNFILILPLIVVPTIAMLRPPDRDRGLVSDDLSAADEFSDFDGDTSKLDDYAKLFDDPLPENAPAFENRSADRDAATARDGIPAAAGDRATTSRFPRSPDRPQLLENLSGLGVTQILWFTPGRSKRIGFAAFVPTQPGTVRYRFEAISDSESAAILDVHRQIQAWQRTRSHSQQP